MAFSPSPFWLYRRYFKLRVHSASCLLLIVLIGIFNAAIRFREDNHICSGMTLGLLLFGLVDSFLESGMVGENFVTLLIGCGIIQIACLKSETDLHERPFPRAKTILYSQSAIDSNPGVAKPTGCNTWT